MIFISPCLNSDWSTSGCTLGSIDVTNGEAKVTCLCNHLTSFAVLIDVSPGEVGQGIYLPIDETSQTQLREIEYRQILGRQRITLSEYRALDVQYEPVCTN